MPTNIANNEQHRGIRVRAIGLGGHRVAESQSLNHSP